MMWIKFILYPLGMFVLWQIIFISEQLSLEFLNAPEILVGIILLGKFTKIIQHIALYFLFHNFLSKNIILDKFSYKLPI